MNLTNAEIYNFTLTSTERETLQKAYNYITDYYSALIRFNCTNKELLTLFNSTATQLKTILNTKQVKLNGN